MKTLKISQLNKKFATLKSLSKHTQGVSSWIKYCRKALGMTPAQLAKKMGIATSTLHQLERQEAQKKASFSSLEKAASAMGFKVIYTFVPLHSIEHQIDKQALKQAEKVVKLSHLQMEYENQALSKKEYKEQIRLLAEEIKNSKKLWEE